ncbi:hypothetical protein J2X20_005507 [Pelomonas saccharophila]|uniref:Uncharacterized protein n=1 Tax=Roseateles saccharophilus TaxID=304 RepID=A0ABU1YVE0_ROSSA|nr:hypothetical protein [Roseateles saccharophilus]MDR7272822.1 hypothetical protein [Roseateles saccharophilus]
MIKLFVFAAAVVFICLAGTTYESARCRHAGYERFIWYEGGKDLGRGAGAHLRAGYFPEADDPRRFESARVRYEDYHRFIQCEGPLKHADVVNVVRFAVDPSFSFVPSTRYSDPEPLWADWFRQPVGDYIPTDVYTAQRMWSDNSFMKRPELAHLGLNPDRFKQAWLSKVDGVPGRKDFVDSLHIDWLRDEPLDQAHILGVWQRGWLFRSAKPGYFVWVEGGQ